MGGLVAGVFVDDEEEDEDEDDEEEDGTEEETDEDEEDEGEDEVNESDEDDEKRVVEANTVSGICSKSGRMSAYTYCTSSLSASAICASSSCT